MRRYSVSGNASVSSDCSSLATVAPLSPPVESTRKRRYFKKGKLGREVKKEAGQVQDGSPCGFPSQVAEPPVRAAGASRLKQEPIHFIPGASFPPIDDEQLSISDRALLRKYGLPGRQQETTRKSDAGHETIPIVQRVDGHPPQGNLKLYDRMLLRKYSVSGSASMPSDSSSLASVPCHSPPVESGKKRRRFYKKANLGGEMKNEAGRVQEGSPCGLPSQVAEPPVRAVTSFPHTASSPGHFTLLYHTLVKDGALPSGYLHDFTSLEAPARRSANRLQASAVAVTDSACSHEA